MSTDSNNSSAESTESSEEAGTGRSRVRWLGASMVLLLVSMMSCIGYELAGPHSIALWKWGAALDALEADNPQRAEQLAQEALEWAPEDPRLRLNYAEMLFRLDREEEARVQIDQAITMADDDANHLAQVGYLLARMRQHDGSLILADKVVQLAREERSMHLHQALNHRAYAIALAAADQKASPPRIEQGLADINEALGRFVEDPEVPESTDDIHVFDYLDTRGYLRVFAGDLPGALEDLNRAIRGYEAALDAALTQRGSPQTGSPRTGASQAEASPKGSLVQQIRQVLAILYSHRAEAYAAMGKAEQAAQDAERAENFGLSRKKGIW